GLRSRKRPSSRCHWRRGWNSSIGWPDGSSSKICEPPGPVTIEDCAHTEEEANIVAESRRKGREGRKPLPTIKTARQKAGSDSMWRDSRRGRERWELPACDPASGTFSAAGNPYVIVASLSAALLPIDSKVGTSTSATVGGRLVTEETFFIV